MKTMAGKRWFYSLGQRALSPLYMGPWPYKDWPKWARDAYFRGLEDQRWSNARQTTKRWSTEKLLEHAS